MTKFESEIFVKIFLAYGKKTIFFFLNLIKTKEETILLLYVIRVNSIKCLKYTLGNDVKIF